MKQLNPIDALFVYNETNRVPMHIGPVMIYDPSTTKDGIVRFKEILDLFANNLHKAPVFRRKLRRLPADFDSPYWVDDPNFDLEFHVRHLALPKPGNWRQLYIQLARLHSRPIDLDRPPWEVHVIEGLDNLEGINSGCFAMFIKVHHSAMGGITAGQILEALHDVEPYPKRAKETVPSWEPETPPKLSTLVGKGYLKLLKSPTKMLALGKNIITSRDLNKTQEQSDDHDPIEITAKTRFNELISPHRVMGGYSAQLDDIKLIKNVAGATVNDVVLGIVGGTMRRYFEEKDELPEESLVAIMPVSTRREENLFTDGGNEVSGIRVRLGTHIADPLERIKAIHTEALHSKTYANAVGADLMVNAIHSVPATLAALGSRAASAANLTAKKVLGHTGVTNVPGTPYPLYMCGAKVVRMFGPGVITDGMGLFHCVSSDNGEVTITFLSCRDMLPDPDLYHQCLSKEYKSLLASAKKAA